MHCSEGSIIVSKETFLMSRFQDGNLDLVMFQEKILCVCTFEDNLQSSLMQWIPSNDREE